MCSIFFGSHESQKRWGSGGWATPTVSTDFCLYTSCGHCSIYIFLMPVGIEPCSNSPASSNSKPDPVDGGTFHHLDILNITLKLIPVSLKSCIGSKFPSKKPP